MVVGVPTNPARPTVGYCHVLHHLSVCVFNALIESINLRTSGEFIANAKSVVATINPSGGSVRS